MKDDRPLATEPDLEACLRPGGAAPGPRGAASFAPKAPERRDTIRVPVDKVDRLINLASELTISRNTREAAAADFERIADRIKGVSRDLERKEKVAEKLAALQADAAALWERFSQSTLHEAATTDALQRGVMRIRMLPASLLFDPAPRLVRDLTKDGRKRVRLTVTGAETELDKKVLEALGDPLTHLLRNAVDHGIETLEERARAGKPEEAVLELKAQQLGNHVEIVVRDDGRGLDASRIAAKAVEKGLLGAAEAAKLTPEQAQALIFLPGFSTKETVTEVSGRGVGMDVVKNNVEALKGRVSIETAPGQGTAFVLRLPLSVAAFPAVEIEAGGEVFFIPTDALSEIVRLEDSSLQREEGQPCFLHRGRTTPIVPLSHLFGLPPRPFVPPYCVVVVKSLEGAIGLMVDRALTEQTVVVKETGRLLSRLPHTLGGTLLNDGTVALVLDPSSIASAAVRKGGVWTHFERERAASVPLRQTPILVADDSLTTRELLRGILETAGYRVVTARDGAEALEMALKAPPRAVLSDVEMPRLDGCGLTKALKADPRTAKVPVILVTAKAADQERRRGLESGADAYVVKGAFDQEGLLHRLGELLGPGEGGRL